MKFIFLIFLTLCAQAADKVPAFPGAEGFGAYSKGGRGGKVLFVTTTLDYSKDMPVIVGSLRAAVEADGPRTVIFRTSGLIHLRRPLEINNPFITIAGQTAPGEGICLTNYAVNIKTHDVIIRYLRIRPGDTIGKIKVSEGGKWDTDALSINKGSKNVIIDHCSMSWANDEVCSVSGEGITNVTVQWCFITESLNDSTHSKGKHGYGSLIRTNGNITFHHNLYAFHRSRSPRPGTYGDGSILLDFRNNFMYMGGQGYTSKDPVRMNFIGNYHPDTPFKATDSCRNFTDNNIGKFTGGIKRTDSFDVAPVNTKSAEKARQDIIQFGGATLPVRDGIDSRIIKLISNSKGQIIDSQTQVGGYPNYKKAEAPKDSDADGMPDSWEIKHGLNPDKQDHNEDKDADGYTNLDEFLNNSDPGAKK